MRLRRLPHLAADGAPIEREGRERERNTPPIMCGRQRATQLAADDAQRERGPRDLRLMARAEREDRERTKNSERGEKQTIMHQLDCGGCRDSKNHAAEGAPRDKEGERILNEEDNLE